MTLPGFVDRIGDYRVERRESARAGGYLRLRDHPAGCLHTTEGSTVNGAWSTLDSRGFAPHFIVGENRIVQMRPLWAQGAALRAWNDRYIQIEAVGFSRLEPHLLTPSSLDPLIAVMRWLERRAGIPLRRPKEWPDTLGAGPWAVEGNPRRRTGRALTFHGWIGHIEVPDNTHWDPGSFRYAEAFRHIQEGDEDLTLEDYIKGYDACAAKVKRTGADPGGPPKDRPEHFKTGWAHARFAANRPVGAAAAPTEPHEHPHAHSLNGTTESAG